MNIPPLINVMCKKTIVDMFVATRKGEYTEEQFHEKFDEVMEYVYNCGREMGMTEALNYVESEADRGRLFNGIDELREELDNEK